MSNILIHLMLMGILIKTANTNNVTSKFDLKNVANHYKVSESGIYPYTVAILKGNTLISSGAILDKNWILTSADGLFLLTDFVRQLRIRLGSINYKKGGVLRFVKLFEIHPLFDYQRPNFDLALVMMSAPVNFKANLKPIKMQKYPMDIIATHFIVTSWPNPQDLVPTAYKSMELIKRQRILAMTHLHPSDSENCAEELLTVNATNDGVMCLDPNNKDLCARDVGAPVVLNGILWGIVSSWTLDDCSTDNATPVFVSLVSQQNTSDWIRTTMETHLWK